MREVFGKRVLVVGLARSGRAVAHCLRRQGAVVTVTDVKPPAEFQEVIPELVREKIGLELGSQRQETFLRQDLIVVSPGVPWDLPQLVAARQWKIPVLPEVEVASWFVQGSLVGVTGTNGKTTTTILLGKILEASGFRTFVGGNVGVPLSLAAEQFDSDSMMVTELSSFQLEGIQDFRPHVAVMLNLSPNHLDRHPSFEAYVQAKRQIFRNQQADDYAILNADDPAVAALAPAVAARPVLFSRRQVLPEGVFVSEGRVLYRVHHLGRPLFETREVALRGAFNLEDVLAATATACTLGADFDAIRHAVREFRGVEHRLEFVRSIEGIEFYNNSKATSVDAAAKSLEAFEGGVHLILGGKDKGTPYAPLRALVKARAREVLLIGAAAERIARELQGAAELVSAGNLETAVREAYQRAQPGDVVLLAPACSSFDQFQDYEHRGRVFKEIVHHLGEEVASGKSAWVAMQEARRRAREAAARVPEPAAPVPPQTEAPPPVVVPEAMVEPEAVPVVEAAEVEPAVIESAPGAEEVKAATEPPVVAAPPAAGPVEPVEVAPEVGEKKAASTPERAESAEPKAEEPPPATLPVEAGSETVPEEASVPSEPAAEPPSPEAAGPSAVEAAEPPAAPEPPQEEAAASEPLHEPEAPAAAEKAGEAKPAEQEFVEPGKPLELEYVYEVAAEELPPLDMDQVPSYEDEIQVVPLEAGLAPEAVEDEILPFESRTVGAVAGPAVGVSTAAAEGGGAAAKPLGAANGNGKRAAARPDQAGQPKLPGID